MRTLTADELAAVSQDSQRVAYCVKIDLTTDLCYTTWSANVTVDATTYVPRGMRVAAASVTDPRNSRASVEIDDLDGAVATSWYTNRFTGQTVTVLELIWYEGAWQTVREIPWVCVAASRSGSGTMRLELSGAGGLRPRAGLMLGSRADFHLAPEPGTSIRIGPTSMTVR